MAGSPTNTNVSTTSGGSALFKGLKTPRDLLNYNLMRGVTDFSNLEQFDLYEKGYPFLVVTSIPQFLADLRDKDPDGIGMLVDNYVHILERDFKGIDNIENITGEASSEISDGNNSINLINNVRQDVSTSFTMSFYERSGSPITKVNELYLTGIKDTKSKVKTYHGLIDDWVFKGIDTVSGKDPGPHQEVFSFLYFVTDNTMTKIERAFLIAAAQPTQANFSDLYAATKGNIEFAEISLNFNGFFINNDFVYEKAQDILLAMRNPKNYTNTRIIVDSNQFKYKAIAEAGLQNDGDPFSSPEYWAFNKGNAANADIATENIRGTSNVYSTNYNENATGDAEGLTAHDVAIYKNQLAAFKDGSDGYSLEHATDYMKKEDGTTNA